MLHFCDSSVEINGELVCYVNGDFDQEFIDDCGHPSTWACHDWWSCFCLNWYIALGLSKAYANGWECSRDEH